MAAALRWRGCGCARAREGEGAEEGEEVGREWESGRGCVASSGASLGRPGRKQEVAEQGGGGARGGVAVSVLLAGRKTTGGVTVAGWAAQELGRLG